MMTRNILKIASFGAVLLASSCAIPVNDGTGLMADPNVNHPIMVEPEFRSVRLPYAQAEAGLLPDDNASFENFVAGYLERGSGSISISVPPTSDGDAAIRYFGERMAEMGVPRDRILTGRRSEAGDGRVELNYVGYQAHVDSCVDWSTNWGDTASNRVTPSFGCASQHNLAAMVSDPRDLASPRAMSDRDNVRRATVLDNYEKGAQTSAQKSSEQSAIITNISQ